MSSIKVYEIALPVAKPTKPVVIEVIRAVAHFLSSSEALGFLIIVTAKIIQYFSLIS
jgi:hypothetical protein